MRYKLALFARGKKYSVTGEGNISCPSYEIWRPGVRAESAKRRKEARQLHWYSIEQNSIRVSPFSSYAWHSFLTWFCAQFLALSLSISFHLSSIFFFLLSSCFLCSFGVICCRWREEKSGSKWIRSQNWEQWVNCIVCVNYKYDSHIVTWANLNVRGRESPSDVGRADGSPKRRERERERERSPFRLPMGEWWKNLHTHHTVRSIEQNRTESSECEKWCRSEREKHTEGYTQVYRGKRELSARCGCWGRKREREQVCVTATHISYKVTGLLETGY